MEYNFKKFIPLKIKDRNIDGVRIGETVGYIRGNIKIEAGDKINISVDRDRNAIQIIKEDFGHWKVTTVNKKYRGISTKSLVGSGVKTGFYKYVGSDIFLLEDKSPHQQLI